MTLKREKWGYRGKIPCDGHMVTVFWDSMGENMHLITKDEEEEEKKRRKRNKNKNKSEKIKQEEQEESPTNRFFH